jgi:hypothetical protein
MLQSWHVSAILELRWPWDDCWLPHWREYSFKWVAPWYQGQFPIKDKTELSPYHLTIPVGGVWLCWPWARYQGLHQAPTAINQLLYVISKMFHINRIIYKAWEEIKPIAVYGLPCMPSFNPSSFYTNQRWPLAHHFPYLSWLFTTFCIWFIEVCISKWYMFMNFTNIPH